MKAIYTRYETRDLLKDLGEDVVHFRAYFRTEDLPEVRIGVLIPYYDLHNFIKQVNPEAYQYITKIRTSMQGYGPKHTKVLAKLEEEGFDLEPYIKQFIESKDEIFISNHLDWVEGLFKLKVQETAKEAIKNINKSLGENYAKDNIKLNDFKDDIDQTLHELTLKYYPEIFDMEEKKIEKYRHALITATLNFSSEIDKILNL